MLDPNETLIINQRFCGPPEMANGGYVSGLLARFINGSAKVTLHRPAPLEQRLSLSRPANGQVELLDDDRLIAKARPARLDLVVPAPPTYEQAQAAGQHPADLARHPFPTCFVCGPRRAAGDGLRIFPGLLPERDLFATTWVPDPSLAADTGLVRPEFVWAALDCPGGVAAVDTKPRPILLGQLVVRIERPVRPNQRYMVIGWAIARSGRKHITGTALFTESGLLCAQGKAIWIEPKTEMTAGKILLKEDATEVRRVGETPWNFNLP